jgi:hypothetical protein
MRARSRLVFVLTSAAFVLGVAAGPGWAQGPVELQVDRFGAFDHTTGVATVTGTLTCPSGVTATLSGSLSQRTTTAGTFLNPVDVPCNGAAEPWTIAFTPLDGRFKGGPADVSVDAVACLSSGCVADHADRRLVLRG